MPEAPRLSVGGSSDTSTGTDGRIWRLSQGEKVDKSVKAPQPLRLSLSDESANLHICIDDDDDAPPYVNPGGGALLTGNHCVQAQGEYEASKQVLKSQPGVLLWPSVLFVILLTLGVAGVELLFKSEADRARAESREVALRDENVRNLNLARQHNNANSAARQVASSIQRGLDQVVKPCKILEVLIRQQPGGNILEENWEAFAEDVLRTSRVNNVSFVFNIQAAPHGILSMIHPLKGNEGAIGHDLLNPCKLLDNQSQDSKDNNPCPDKCEDESLIDEVKGMACYKNRRDDALAAITKRDAVLAGPVSLQQGYKAVIVRNPVFLDWNTTGAYNETFGRSYGPHECPECYDETFGKRFWGFTIMLANLTSVVFDVADAGYLTRAGYAFCLKNNGTEDVIVNTHPGADYSQAENMTVAMPNAPHILSVVPIKGWDYGNSSESDAFQSKVDESWEGILLAGLILLCLVLHVSMSCNVIRKKRHQILLQTMLPKKTLPYVERGVNFSESFSNITVLFTDIVSYTTLASKLTPLEVVRMLNQLYNTYDSLPEMQTLYKVETIGDAYMCAGGVPDAADKRDNAERVARFALAMLQATCRFRTADGISIQIRVGIHSGPAVGAVIGLKMPHYCLCGDTINVASRMESNSAPMSIHISNSTQELLKDSLEFVLESRGEIDVKGKGKMNTFWLRSADPAVNARISQHVGHSADEAKKAGVQVLTVAGSSKLDLWNDSMMRSLKDGKSHVERSSNSVLMVDLARMQSGGSVTGRNTSALSNSSMHVQRSSRSFG